MVLTILHKCGMAQDLLPLKEKSRWLAAFALLSLVLSLVNVSKKQMFQLVSAIFTFEIVNKI
jgi:hypothetical protein